MAVVQISKIQIRRGKKNSGNGLPQLASGELAWAIDTQELYVGNGAVGEGAPAVGNTKILTENDSILDLLEQYQYKASSTIQTGVIVPVKRTVLARLDEGSVNAASFGISGLDVSYDQTAAIQNAIYSLYLPSESLSTNRVTLEFDPGVYTITGTIYVPSNVRLVGSGRDRTVFNFVKGGINSGTQLTLSGTSIQGSGSYTNLPVTTVTGSGSGAIVSVSKTGALTSYSSGNTTVTIVKAGGDYSYGDIIKVLGSALGGVDGTNDLTITLTAKTGVNATFDTNTMFEFVNDLSTRTLKSPSTSNGSINQPKYILMDSLGFKTNRNDSIVFNFRNVRDSEFKNLSMTGTWVNGTVDSSSAIDMFATSFVLSCQKNKFHNINIEGFTYAVSANSPIINNIFDECYLKNLHQGFRFGVGSGSLSPRKNTISNSFFENISNHGILVDNGYGNRSRGNTFINVGNDGGGFANNQVSIIKFNSSGNSSIQDNFDRTLDLSGNNYDSRYIQEIEGVAFRNELEPIEINLIASSNRVRAFRFPLSNTSGFEVKYVFTSTTVGFKQTRKGTMHIAVDKINNNFQLVDDYEFLGTTGQDELLEFSVGVEDIGGVSSVVVYYINNTGSQNSFTYTYSALS
jgi:hypothetical protein